MGARTQDEKRGSGGTQVEEGEQREEAEAQYVETKTLVWWDIENCPVPFLHSRQGLSSSSSSSHSTAQNIASALKKMNYRGPISISAYGDTNRIPTSVQHALSSTGITLNHVPSGVKDASDKKILVDMLFWAVGNPAPANYLLISGDRDFSNALHQLRMRRYNILLAQPPSACAPLVAAAKSVWIWSVLLAGGSPLPNKGRDTLLLHPVSGSVSLGNQKISSNARTFGNSHKVVKQVWKVSQFNSISRTSGDPVHEDAHQSNESFEEEQLKVAPHQFFGAKKSKATSSTNSTHSSDGTIPKNLDPSLSTWNRLSSNYELHYPHHARSKSLPTEANSDPVNVYSQSTGYPFGFQSPHHLQPENRVSKSNFNTEGYPVAPELASSGMCTNDYPIDFWDCQGCPQPPDYMEGLICVILLALGGLKENKMAPTEANIADWILYGDPTHHNIDVKEVLDISIERGRVNKRQVGALQVYIGKTQGELWRCVNPIGGNLRQHPKEVWDEVKKFLLSPNGRSDVIASKCRFEAATILRDACLQNYVLGDVLLILDTVITIKRWIKPHFSGWQPVKVSPFIE
ncbi:uncharacterized protein LOC113334337 [Papaver somniferum]|uniref:uncharacterized protein LOC113334337 n=1 Tax=Papaver somniferum TaxID=3469 RepID=UPI000E6F927B|nr:uncharacterized protein LOC113334337 [Papaver somniferum]